MAAIERWRGKKNRSLLIRKGKGRSEGCTQESLRPAISPDKGNISRKGKKRDMIGVARRLDLVNETSEARKTLKTLHRKGRWVGAEES